MENTDKYTDFSLEDFLSDTYFAVWVQQPNPENDVFWRNWLGQHPEKEKTISLARDIVKSMRFSDEFPNKQPDALYQRIEAKLVDQPSNHLFSNPWLWRGVAAAVILLIGLAVFLNQSKEVEYTTKYAETREVWLPDSSKVTLNANSSIRCAENWDKNEAREVVLEGEAFFNVHQIVHKDHKQKFIVHTHDIDIEVLGTTFNVNTKRKATTVVLNSGKVEVNNPSLPEATPVILNPGEKAEFDIQQKAFKKEQVVLEEYISWKDHQFIFNQTPLSEIIQLLKETYDYHIIVRDSLLFQEKIVGTFPSDDPTILFETLRTSIQIEELNDTIFLSPL